MKLGFVGLGATGVPMVENLIEAGHELAVWNRTGGRAGARAETGAGRDSKPADYSHATQFKLVHLVKDLYYALDLDRGGRTSLPVAGLVSQIYTAGLREHGEKDISAVSEAGRRPA